MGRLQRHAKLLPFSGETKDGGKRIVLLLLWVKPAMRLKAVCRVACLACILRIKDYAY